MTIAAGFLLREGVLLCADTEYTGVQHKSQDSKVGWFGFSGGVLAYALAGNEDNAKTAIDRLQRELMALRPAESVRDVIDRVLNHQYRKLVLSCDDKAAGDYQMMLGLATPDAKPAQLFVTRLTGVRPVRSFACIGYGSEFARQILKSQISLMSEDRDIWNLACYTLGIVKKSVPYCGGASILVTLRNTGEVGLTTSD